MVTTDITRHRRIAAPAAAIWAVVRDFCGAWHPLIEGMDAEPVVGGGLIRRFTTKGENTIYRERLTYLSESDRVMAYRHVEGIQDVAAYDAEVNVVANGPDQCDVTWSARIIADEPRATEIATGTGAIFDLGLSHLASGLSRAQPFEKRHRASSAAVHLAPITIDSAPSLALTATPTRPGPVVVFLHGIGGNRGNWDRQLAAAAEVFTAVALDLRGYGNSELGVAPSTVESYCDDIKRVMAHFVKDRVILCGLSYGAWIATSFAMRFPEQVAGLILSGGCTGMSEASIEEQRAFRESREAPLDAGKTPADFAEAVVNVIASPHADQHVRRALHDSMAAIPVATYRDALTCFTSPGERFDFSKLNMPVLMITGEHDRLASPGEIRGVSRRILAASPTPDVRFEVIAGAGHVCNIEAPDAYNRLVSEFLRRMPR